MCQRLGTPNTPANPFHAGGEFRGFHGSLICYGLPGCSAPCTDLTGFPAIGAFYFQASNEIGPLLDITTASTGLLCWRDFHPQEWQLDSLHGTLSPSTVVYQLRQFHGVKRTPRGAPLVGSHFVKFDNLPSSLARRLSPCSRTTSILQRAPASNGTNVRGERTPIGAGSRPTIGPCHVVPLKV